MTRSTLAAIAAIALMASGCDSLPGKPSPDDRPIVPTEIKDFAALFAANCAGCHGAGGTLGAATPLASPVYLALADDASIEAAITRGVPGTAMPAFAASEGGMLTDEQIDILVSGMRKEWSDPAAVSGVPLPAYAASASGSSPGEPARGQSAFGTFCASCHGPAGEGGSRGGAVVERSYLALVSDQGLRTAVLVGRPDLGMPDWRGYVPGRPMAPQEISDVVAWLAAQR